MMNPDIAILQDYLIVGLLLFGIGLVGFLSRRNMIVMFLAAEMMLQGVSLSLVAWGRYHNDFGGQMLVLFIIAVAACEAAIALAMILMLFQRRGSLDIAVWQELREANVPAYVDHGVPEEPNCRRPVAAPAAGRRGAGDSPRGNGLPPPCLASRTLLILIPALPLAAALVTAVLGKRVLGAAEPRAGGHGHRSVVPGAAWCCWSRSTGKPSRLGRNRRLGQDAGEDRHPLDLGHRARRLPADTPFEPGRRQRQDADRVSSRDFRIDVTLRADPLTAVMLVDGHVHLAPGGRLLGRLHARRSGLLAVLHLHRAVRLLDDDAGLGEQLPAAVRVLGRRSGCAATC